MARTKAEQQQPATGMTLIVLVGLAIAFLLFMAFLNVVKSGNILNEDELALRRADFLCRSGRTISGFRSDWHSVVREVCIVSNLASD